MFNEVCDRAFVMAKDIAPKDTYNLVLRAMSLQNYGLEKAIVYSGFNAPYIDYLEYGTKNFDGHKGFISDTTYSAVIRLVESSYNGRFDEEQFTTIKDRVDALQPNLRTDYRYLQSIGGVY